MNSLNNYFQKKINIENNIENTITNNNSNNKFSLELVNHIAQVIILIIIIGYQKICIG